MVTRLRLGFLALVLVAGLAWTPADAAQHPTPKEFTEWGWPQPYDKISEKSVKWLKDKGWWPLSWGYQPPWMGQATIPWIVKEKGLDKQRGLEVQLVPFLAGPPLNEALIAGKLQMGHGGNFPITTLIVRKAPVRSPGIVWTPALEQSILVHPDSPIKKPQDLKGKTVGLVTGSSAEFAFVGYARAHGLDPHKDVTLKPMPIPDQATMPKGIDAVVPWSVTPTLMWKYRKNAKLFDDTGPFQLYWGTLHMREELFQNTPDVVQAIVDMSVEALLWGRLHPREMTDIVKKDPALGAYPWEHLYDENIFYMNNLKPTWIYPFIDVYAPEGARVAKFLHEGGRVKELLTEKDYREWFQGGTSWFDTTFRKLGWRIPKEPPYFPKGVTTQTFREWLRTGQRFNFVWPYKLETPQPWPEPADLEKPWYYAGRWHSPAGR
jgi:sulfonate transport system substrate-binding protein